MNNYASKSLCEELYKLSGWICNPVVSQVQRYDLGYLLRKLPSHVDDGWFGLWKTDKGRYSCGYVDDSSYILEINNNDLFEAEDTPEDAACKLAIQLIKDSLIEGRNDGASE